MTTYKLAIKNIGEGTLQIPKVDNFDFANDLAVSVVAAFDTFYPQVNQHYCDEVIQHGGSGAFMMSGPRRMCKACGRPILLGDHAWAFMRSSKKNVILAIDTARSIQYGVETGMAGPKPSYPGETYCCPKGEEYNRIRNEFILRNIQAIKVSLADSTAMGCEDDTREKRTFARPGRKAAAKRSDYYEN